MSALVDRGRAKLEAFAGAEISSRSLALVRIFGTVLMLFRFAPKMNSHHLDQPLAVVLAWLLFLSAGFVIVGFQTRGAAIIMAVSLAVLHTYYGSYLQDPSLAKPVLPMQMSILLALTPSGRSLSIDRVLEVRKAQRQGREPEPERMPWWQLELFLLTICSLYLWTAYDKTDIEWFRGERMERYYLEWYGGSDSMAYSRWVHPIAVFMACATTLLEFTLAFGLLIRRYRHYVLWGGVMLHLGILYSLSVPYFSILMLSILIAAMRPDKVHEFLTLLADDGASEDLA